MKEYLAQIITLINAFKSEHGQNLYYLLHSSTLSLGDESAHQLYVWDRTNWNEELEPEFYDLDQELGKSINKLTPTGTWTLQDTGLERIWRTADGDMIHLYYSDNCIHLHLFNSGQY